jgi:hypothetical protein
VRKERKNRMAATLRKYSCKNCGSVFEPSLKADFEHIKVRCSFCRHEASLVPVPDWETPEQYQERTGKAWPDDWAVYYRYVSAGGKLDIWRTGYYKNIANSNHDFRSHNAGHHQMVCATESGIPPDGWRPGEMEK